MLWLNYNIPKHINLSFFLHFEKKFKIKQIPSMDNNLPFSEFSAIMNILSQRNSQRVTTLKREYDKIDVAAGHNGENCAYFCSDKTWRSLREVEGEPKRKTVKSRGVSQTVPGRLRPGDVETLASSTSETLWVLFLILAFGSTTKKNQQTNKTCEGPQLAL